MCDTETLAAWIYCQLVLELQDKRHQLTAAEYGKRLKLSALDAKEAAEIFDSVE